MAGCHRAKKVQIHGTVVDDVTGQPIRNVDICLHSTFHTLSHPIHEWLETTTDGAGQFAFPKIRVRDDLVTVNKTDLQLCAMKDGYDWTHTYLNYFSKFGCPLEIRLEKDPAPLPAGWLSIEGRSKNRISGADAPTFRFVFASDTLRFAEPEQESDFELHYRLFVADDENGWDNLFGAAYPSKNGEGQFLESVTAAPNRLRQVYYRYKTGHPPRLDLETAELRDSFSFHQPYDDNIGFGEAHEFLLETRDGKYALLHFDIDSIKWVYQPDGSIDLRRRRKRDGAHCDNCR